MVEVASEVPYMISMSPELKTARMQVILTPAELERLDDWRFARRIGSRAEAIRQLLNLGIAADAAGWSPDAPEAKPKRPRKGA